MSGNQSQRKNGAELRASAEGKTVSDAFAKALARLEELTDDPFDREEVEVIVISEGSKGFLGMGSTMARVEVRLPSDDGDEGDAAAATEVTPEQAAEAAACSEAARERLQDYLGKVLEGLGLEGDVEILELEDELVGKVDGPDLGLFIGRHGQTLDAVQYLANVIAYRQLAARKRVVVDAEDYRDRRAETLRAIADRGASEVLKGRPRYELKPMSAAERRIVHLYLQDREGIETLSEGKEPFRHVVIAPAGD